MSKAIYNPIRSAGRLGKASWVDVCSARRTARLRRPGTAHQNQEGDPDQGRHDPGQQAQKVALLAAGQVMLTVFDGAVFQVSYLLGSLGGSLIGAAMLRSRVFSRAPTYP